MCEGGGKEYAHALNFKRVSSPTYAYNVTTLVGVVYDAYADHLLSVGEGRSRPSNEGGVRVDICSVRAYFKPK